MTSTSSSTTRHPQPPPYDELAAKLRGPLIGPARPTSTRPALCGVRAAYLGNYDRLAQVKSKYDPKNLFHVNQNIPPSSPPVGRGTS
jgi:hypothetical protein